MSTINVRQVTGDTKFKGLHIFEAMLPSGKEMSFILIGTSIMKNLGTCKPGDSFNKICEAFPNAINVNFSVSGANVREVESWVYDLRKQDKRLNSRVFILLWQQ